MSEWVWFLYGFIAGFFLEPAAMFVRQCYREWQQAKIEWSNRNDR